MLQGFKEFIARGNVIELAVGVIIGNAFKGLVDELVTDILNPAIGALFGKADFTKSFILQIGESQILFGALLTAIINFLLIAFAVYFFIVVPMNYFAKMRGGTGGGPAHRRPARLFVSTRRRVVPSTLQCASARLNAAHCRAAALRCAAAHCRAPQISHVIWVPLLF